MELEEVGGDERARKRAARAKLKGHAAKFPPLLETLERIEGECLGTKKKEEDGENLDDFTRKKKRVGKQIKEVRQLLKRRDALFARNASDTNAIKLSALARRQIKELLVEAAEMQEMLEAEKKKWAKKKKKKEGVDQLLYNRTQIVKLTFLHIQECEMLERRRSAEAAAMTEATEKLFELREEPRDNANGSYGVVNLPDVSSIPDIEVADGFAQQETNEVRINQMLDQVLDGVIDLKELATAMGHQIEEGDVVINEVDRKVEDANTHLDNLNGRLKTILDDVRAPRKLIVDIILVVLFLGMLGLMIKIVSDRT